MRLGRPARGLYNGSMSAGPVVTPWIVFPLAAVTLLIVAAHILALRESAPGRMPESRRRIRVLTGWVTLATVPMLACGFGFVPPSDASLFATLWIANIVMLATIIALALLDACNTVRLARRANKDIRRQMRRALAEIRGTDG